MLGRTQRPHHRKVAALIGQKTHRLSFGPSSGYFRDNRLFVCHGVSGITDRRVNILCRKTRIGIQQGVFAGAFAELPQNQLDGNATTALGTATAPAAGRH